MPDEIPASIFFRDAAWRRRFDDEVLAVAGSFVPKAKNLQLEEVAPGSFALEGIVAGEEAKVEFWRDGVEWDFESSCSC